MPDSSAPVPADAGIEVRTYFVRNRNVLLARAGFSDLYVDYYLHLAEHRLQPAPEADALFKRTLAAFVLHCASRPWKELNAWTVNFQQPLLNLFLCADNDTGGVTGRAFEDNVKVLPTNLFYADVVRGNEPKRRSAVEFEGADPLAAVEKFYAQSEQRTARIFEKADEDFVLLSEHPDCDLAWLRGLTPAALATLDQTETLVLMERRLYRWHCGCNQRRMLEVLAPAMREDPEQLFGGEEKLEIRCPRCGARHAVTRETLEAFVAGGAGGGE